MSTSTAHGSQQQPRPQPCSTDPKITQLTRHALSSHPPERIGRPSPIPLDLTGPSRPGSGNASATSSAVASPLSMMQEASQERGANQETRSNFKLVPFPRRPGSRTLDELAQEEALSNRGPRIEQKGLIGSLETPHDALRYPAGKPADFAPWIGGHIEDVLSEQTIKSGFQNKPVVTNETNTAKPSVWNQLKSKQGTGTLSNLFAAVLEKRQAAGKLTTSSTFKLPPRVTLTGTRREAWLQDLANPAVPLRKLSRTIPFGVSGKALLEQCLGKNIPIPRAIWLLKCVGANELRAFKRKGVTGTIGVSGEAKWIREWTCSVESFIESILGNCGEQGWSVRIQYVIRLTVNIFAERLLDQEHYLHWILSSLEKSAVEQLPFWTIIAQIHWKHLLASRQRGKYLATCLLTQLEALSSDRKEEVYASIRNRLQNLVLTIAVANRGCLLGPQLWAAFDKLVRPYAAALNRPVVNKVVNDLRHRNVRLDASKFHSGLLCRTPRQQLNSILDAVKLDVNILQLTSQCGEIKTSVTEVCRLALDWASSKYRQGDHRAYLVARLLRRYASAGVDVENVFIQLAHDISTGASQDFTIILKVIAELVRSNHFSVAKYLQAWISSGVTQGGTTDSASKHGATPFSRLTLILQNLPLDHLPSHVSSLARILMANSDTEMDSVREMNLYIDSITPQTPLATLLSLVASIEHLDLTLSQRFRISRAMRSAYQADINTRLGKTSIKQIPSRHDNTTSQFIGVRRAIEILGDYPILADVIGMTASNASCDLLASLVDTLTMHSKTFASIGALRPLYSVAKDRYTSLRQQDTHDATLIRALLRLHVNLSDDPTVATMLKTDLARREQNNAITMCSPASDNATDHMAFSLAAAEDEIERILTSGTIMDQPQIIRVFKRLATYLLEVHAKKEAQAVYHQVAVWMSRLRTFDPVFVDSLTASWARQLLVSNRALMFGMLNHLLGAECLTLATFVQVLDVVAGGLDRANASDCQLEFLQYVFETSAVSSSSWAVGTPERPTETSMQYRAELERQLYIESNGSAVLTRLIRLDPSIAAVGKQEQMYKVIRAPKFSTMLTHIIVMDAERFADMISQASSSPVVLALQQMLSERLGINAFDIYSSSDKAVDAKVGNAPSSLVQITSIADELSLSFAISYLHCVLAGISGSTLEELARDFVDQALSNTYRRCVVWADVIVGLSGVVKQAIRTQAINRLSAATTSADARISTTPSLQDILQLIDCCPDTTVLNATSSSSSSSSDSACTDKIRDFISLSPQAATQPNLTPLDITRIEAALHLATLYPPSSKPTPTSNNLTLFLTSATTLLTCPAMQAHVALQTHLFDLITLLSDTLTEEQRTLITKNDAINTEDPRVAFVYGCTPVADAWLGLVMSLSNGTNTITTTITTPGAASPSLPSPTQRPPLPHQHQHPHLPRKPTPLSNLNLPPQPQLHLPPRPPTPLQRTPSGMAIPQSQIQAQVQPPPQHLHQQQLPKTFNPPIPYILRRWEILPDQTPLVAGGGAPGSMINDSAISLGLFGMRKVV